MRRLLAAVLILGLAACTDQDAAIQTLADAGDKSITITGNVWFSGCGFGELYRTGFVAISLNRSVVSGVVCKQSWPSGSSIIRTYS